MFVWLCYHFVGSKLFRSELRARAHDKVATLRWLWPACKATSSQENLLRPLLLAAGIEEPLEDERGLSFDDFVKMHSSKKSEAMVLYWQRPIPAVLRHLQSLSPIVRVAQELTPSLRKEKRLPGSQSNGARSALK